LAANKEDSKLNISSYLKSSIVALLFISMLVVIAIIRSNIVGQHVVVNGTFLDRGRTTYLVFSRPIIDDSSREYYFSGNFAKYHQFQMLLYGTYIHQGNNIFALKSKNEEFAAQVIHVNSAVYLIYNDKEVLIFDRISYSPMFINVEQPDIDL